MATTRVGRVATFRDLRPDKSQAAVSLCAAVGVTDLTVPMYRCECRNRERGRL